MAAEVYLFQFNDVLELLDALVSSIEPFDHFLDLSLLFADLVEELLLDCLQSAVDLSHLVDLHL